MRRRDAALCLAASLVMLLTGCTQAEPGPNPTLSADLSSGTSAVPASFVSGMGCDDPTCTEPAHYHNCPSDCTDYEHHHHCGLDCTDPAHNHHAEDGSGSGREDHEERHSGSPHHSDRDHDHG